MLSKKASKALSLASLALMGVTLVLAGWIVLNKQLVSDNVIGFFYQPTGEVLQLEDRVGFSDEGKRIFRATQPELSGAEEFNSQCPRREVKSPIIGCYTSDDRVYVYNVTNPELDGIEEVTAAHEMLHAAWSRLSSSEREHLSKLLRGAYSNIKDDNLDERIQYYTRTEPSEVNNELHSILGTEHRGLTPELEEHYSRYFTDRNTVLDFHSKYSGKYQSLQDQSDSLWSQLSALSDSITKDQKTYLSQSAVLNSDINAFNRRADSGGFSSMATFNAERAALTGRISQLELRRTKINNDIEEYNSLYRSYRHVAAQIEDLNKSIDSFESLEALPTL